MTSAALRIPGAEAVTGVIISFNDVIKLHRDAEKRLSEQRTVTVSAAEPGPGPR